MTDILFAEDEAIIRETVALALEREKCNVRTVPDGEAALKAYEEKRPDLIILDVMMPKVSGWDVVSAIRKKDRTVPILMLSARAAESDKVTGLNLGADDYLGKPFGVAELRARVAALLRRAGVSAEIQPENADFSFGACRIVASRSVLIAADGTEKELTKLELGLLRFLAAHPNGVVTRDHLLNGLWGVSYTGSTRTIDVRIAGLRQKLGPDGARIESVYGIGYRYRAS